MNKKIFAFLLLISFCISVFGQANYTNSFDAAVLKERIKKLSADEMQYLRMNDPVTYAKMAKVQIQRKALESRLKQAKSKEEALEIYTILRMKLLLLK